MVDDWGRATGGGEPPWSPGPGYGADGRYGAPGVPYDIVGADPSGPDPAGPGAPTIYGPSGWNGSDDPTEPQGSYGRYDDGASTGSAPAGRFVPKAAQPVGPDDDPALPGWMRRVPSADYGAAGGSRRERARHLADRVRGRPPLNAPVYAYVDPPAPQQRSFWSAGKGVLLGGGFAVCSLALALTLVALVRTSPDDAVTDPDGGVAIAGDPSTTLPSDLDDGETPLAAPTSSSTTATTEASTTSEAPTTVTTTASPTTAPATTAPPSTTTPTTIPTTTTRPTTTRPPQPVINSLSADATSGFCGDRNEVRTRFSWSTTNATEARFGRQNRSSQSVDPDDSLETCARRGSTWVLTVTGSGDTVSGTVQAPG